MNSKYPQTRLQRYRRTPARRALFSETNLQVADLMMPIFVHESLSESQPISSMPGIFQLSVSDLGRELQELVDLGIGAVMVFGIPAQKSRLAEAAFDENGVVQRAIRFIKSSFPQLVVAADCCLCEYTDNGHCGIFTDDGQWDNDGTLQILEKIARSYAKAGVDMIAPSGMIDGCVGHIRQALDQSGFQQTMIMSYAVKFASAFYGPFRFAAGTQDVFCGDRHHHQLAPSQIREALHEADLDRDEGADVLMVKPAFPYLDILSQLRERSQLPLAAYCVSGTYAMIKAASEKGLFDEQSAVMELMMSMKRAGANIIVSYFAKDVAGYLKEGRI